MESNAKYRKCLDYEMTEPLEQYRVLLTAVARLAGTHRSGRLPAHLTAHFPLGVQAATVGERAPLSMDKLDRRLTQLAEFAATHPGLLPGNVGSPEFLARLREDAPRFAHHEHTIARQLTADDDYVALCHWNANVDNAWLWRDTDDVLHCGLMDPNLLNLWERHRVGDLLNAALTESAIEGDEGRRVG
jgi:hypothetical protein